MKRRDVLRGLTVAAGGALLPSPAWSLFLQAADQKTSQFDAVPIRGLAKKDGKLLQPVQITIKHTGGGATAITNLNGVQVDTRTISQGTQTFQILTEAVTLPQDVSVAVTIGE